MGRNRPVHSALALAGQIDAIVEPMEVEGCEVIRDDDAGTIEVAEEHGEVIFRAIQKGAEGQPWICMYYNAGRFSWGPKRCDTCNNALPDGATGPTCGACLAIIITNSIRE